MKYALNAESLPRIYNCRRRLMLTTYRWLLVIAPRTDNSQLSRGAYRPMHNAPLFIAACVLKVESDAKSYFYETVKQRFARLPRRDT